MTRSRNRCGEGRNRTGDTTVFSRVLYRLSYLAAASKSSQPFLDCGRRLVRGDGAFADLGVSAELAAAVPIQRLVQLLVRPVHEELSFRLASTDEAGEPVVRPAHQLAANRLIVTLVELPDQR